MEFPIEMLDHVDEWVAFSHDRRRVAGYGSTVSEAGRMARRSGEDRPIFFFVASRLLVDREPERT